MVGQARCKQLALSQMEDISRQSTMTTKSSKRTEYGLRETQNYLLDLSVDLFR